MKLKLDPTLGPSLIDQARQQVVSGLHAGLLRPGARLPSIRSVARVSGLNAKTVLRVYAQLEEEGLLALRPGSGSFVTGREPDSFDQARVVGLRRLLRRHLDEASAMNLTAGHYVALAKRFVARDGLDRKSVAVIECNVEQVRLFAREIGLRLGVRAHPVLLKDVNRKTARRILEDCSVIAVTDFHLAEGRELGRRLHKPVAGLRLQRDFLPAVMEAARHGRLAMIVSDTGFFPAFKRSLGQLGLDRPHLDRIRVAVGAERAAALEAMSDADTIYISPLCNGVIGKLAPHGARLLAFQDHIATESIEEMEAWLLVSGTGPDHRTPDGA